VWARWNGRAAGSTGQASRRGTAVKSALLAHREGQP
jgi:hypothetical protein